MPGPLGSTIRRALWTAGFVALAVGGAHAGRPLLDQHQWDGYFALFAQNSSVPWKSTVVRLDTYSGAAVDFAAYAIDPAEVIVAGANRPARAIDTSKRQPSIRWRFSPPSGYRLATSDVAVPLGASEGFYVIEARRGDAAQQVWVNRSRIGLLTKESPEGLVLWGVDLRSGHVVRNLHVQFLAGGALVSRTTDANGIVTWHDRRRATFVLADSSSSRAFVSLLPQAPLPQSIIGLRVQSTVVRAGDHAVVVGFARRRSGGVLQRATGEVKVTLSGHGTMLAAVSAQLDPSGAFSADLPIPTSAAAGDYAVLANGAGGVGGTSLHVDAASALSLSVSSACPCDAVRAVALTVAATRGGVPAAGVAVNLDVVRTPHIVPPGEADDAPRWGATSVMRASVVTGSDGRARADIPPPTDGLASTYGVTAATAGNGATATTQVVVPTAALALAVEPDATSTDVGQPVGFEVRGFSAADDTPAAGLTVTVRLSHGATAAEQTVQLDDGGRAHVVFRSPSLGSNLAVVQAAGADGRRASDAAAVSVAPQGLAGATGAGEGGVRVTLDQPRYHRGDHIGVTIDAPGSAGDALVTLEGARTYSTRIVALSGGRATTTLELPSAEGDVRVSAAVVRDGAVALGNARVSIDAPGHARAMTLVTDKTTYSPGAIATLHLRDGDNTPQSTIVVRVTDGLLKGGAVLDDLPALLSLGGTTSQSSAPENPPWHAWVAPARSKVSDLFSAERPSQGHTEAPSIGSAAPRTILWRIDRASGSSLDVPLPHEPGTFIVSVLRVFDDGDVGGGQNERHGTMNSGRGVPAPGTATLMLLDTYGLVYRAFFALPALATTKGLPISAAYGFTMMLTKIIADEKPTHVIACFDKGPPRARIDAYAEYKAQRQEMPGDLRPQFALVRRILETYKIPSMEIEGEEADDVIATLARRAEEAGQRTSVVTGDLDLLQIVDEATTVLVTRRGITELGRYDPAAVRERFDLEPAQLADYRGLKGDPSDNLPGIPGVGEKTAIKLVRVAGSLDALLANPVLAGSPKLEKLVREYGEQARVCRDVSVVARDLPLSVPWSEAEYRPPEPTELAPLYREFEFKTLLARLPQPDQDAAEAAGADEPVQGHYLSFVASTDPPDFRRLATMLQETAQSPRVALAHSGGELGVSGAAESGFSFTLAALTFGPVADAFRALAQNGSRIVAHDAKGLAEALRQVGHELAEVHDDTMVAAHLLNPSRSYPRLSDAVSEYLGLGLPGDVAAHADAVLRLTDVTRDRLVHRGQLSLYDDVEVPLVAILAKTERTGIAVDPAELQTLAAEVDEAAVRLQDEIYGLAGETFNIGSPQQLGRILFESLKLPSGGRTKTGWATGAEVLQGLAREYEICAKVLEFREVTKLKNTYIDVLPALVGADGRVHTIFNQTSTATGRLSSTNPNLQNIPVRSELGRRVRRAFVAPGPSRVLLAADYSQIELRIMAHLSGDEAMREAFRRGDDIHDFTARSIFGVAAPAVPTANQRRIAKSVNFGLLYGMSEFGLAQRLEIDRAEARAMTDAYFARFPGVRDYIRRNLDFGRENGYVETILGRRRYMPDLRSRHFALRSAAEREATNAPMQGSAADLMKLAMVRADRALANSGSDALLLLQIHDELVFEVAAAQLDEVAKLVRREMENAIELTVPVEVTLKTGRNWYEVASYDVEPDDVEPAEA